MKGFENNKYAKKIDFLVSQNVDNDRLFAHLRYKANMLRKKKSLELMKLICTPILIENERTLKRINKLINTGADVNYTTLEGISPFILASLNGQIYVAEFLKEKGANIMHKTKEGQNALMLTVYISQMARSGEFKSHRNVKYMPMIRKLREYGLADNMHCDFLGLTLNNYYMGEIAPYQNHLMDEVEYFIDSNRYSLENDNINIF